MKQLFTFLLMLPTFIVAQSIEIVSQPTTFAASGTAYAPSEGQPPYIMRFKGYDINAAGGDLYVPIRSTSAIQTSVSAATLSASGDQTNKNGAENPGTSQAYGIASGVHGKVIGDAAVASANERLLNYTDNGDGTFDVDVVINAWSNGITIPNDANITPVARFFTTGGTKVGIPVIEDSNNAGTYVVAGATFDNTTVADTGSNLLTKATAILTDLDDTDDLVLNSGFDNVNKHWYGNHGTIEVRTENDNSFFFADVASAGDAYAVNLQQKINITQGEHYILSFEASTNVGRTIIAGIGKIGGAWDNVSETITLTDTPQVFELNLNPGFAVGDEQRVFFDLGADVGIVVIDDVSVRVNENPPVDPAPTDAPTTPPTRDAADVISIYGEAYGTAVGLNSVTWDGGSDTTEETIAGNAVLKTTFADFIGFDLASEIDASDMTHMHLDIWISDAFAAGQVFKPTFSNWGGDGSAETDKFEYNYAVGATDAESWVSLDLSFSDWTSLAGAGSNGRANLKQFLIGVASTLNTVYIDNIYLYKETTTGGGGGTTPETTTYCETEVTHFNIEAETASTIVLTIKNSGDDKITVSATGVNSPIDLLFVGANATGGTPSATTINDGVASFDITWAAGTMPETATFELLWSTEASGGNWMLQSGTGEQGLGNIDTSNDCSQLGIVNHPENTFMIYPNPVQNTLNVSAAASVDSVSIFDITGREVLRATPNTAAFSLDVATLNKGLYLVSLKAGDQEMTTKLVK